MNAMVLALAMFVGAQERLEQAPTTGINWTSYSQAQQQSSATNKPIAVFFGSGQDGYRKAVKEGNLSAESQRTLTEKFLPVYVDVSTPEGRDLADSFQIAGDVGVVLSERGGVYQSFYRAGTVSSSELQNKLNVVFRTNSRVSLYPPADGNGGVGGSCPDGNCSISTGASCPTGTCTMDTCTTGTCTTGACSTGTCSTGTCTTGTCSTGGCNSGCSTGNCGGRRGFLRRCR